MYGVWGGEEKKVNQFTGRFSAFTSSTDINTIHLRLYIDLGSPHPLSRFFLRGMILLLLHSCPHRHVIVSGFFYFLNLSLNLGQDTLQRASVSKVTLKYYFYHLAQTFFT